MRRNLLTFVATVAAVVLLLGYRPTTPTPAAAATSLVASGSTRTVTGPSVDTRWGPVQVQIAVSGSRLTAVNALVVPSGNRRDAEINGYAVPVLTAEALQAQSASIDSVSGATFTSDGYRTSLQAALDAAGL